MFSVSCWDIYTQASFIPEPPVLIACSMQKQILQVIKAGPEGGLGAMQKLLKNPYEWPEMRPTYKLFLVSAVESFFLSLSITTLRQLEVSTTAPLHTSTGSNTHKRKSWLVLSRERLLTAYKEKPHLCEEGRLHKC